MKTPDEIKKALECCFNVTEQCGECPYYPVSCDKELVMDARVYIRQLEAERDAAGRDMTEVVQNSGDPYCEYCKNWKSGTCPQYCRTHSEGFIWRGVQKEE